MFTGKYLSLDNLPWFSHYVKCVFRVFPCFFMMFYDCSIDLLRFSHDSPLFFCPWCSILSYSHDFPMFSQLFSMLFLYVPMFFSSFSVTGPCFSMMFAIIFPCFFDWFTMMFPWFCFSMFPLWFPAVFQCRPSPQRSIRAAACAGAWHGDDTGVVSAVAGKEPTGPTGPMAWPWQCRDCGTWPIQWLTWDIHRIFIGYL